MLRTIGEFRGLLLEAALVLGQIERPNEPRQEKARGNQGDEQHDGAHHNREASELAIRRASPLRQRKRKRQRREPAHPTPREHQAVAPVSRHPSPGADASDPPQHPHGQKTNEDHQADDDEGQGKVARDVIPPFVGDDLPQLGSHQAESNARDQKIDDLPEGGGENAVARSLGDLASVDLQSGDDHGDDSGGVHFLSREIGNERGDHCDRASRRDVVDSAVCNADDPPEQEADKACDDDACQETAECRAQTAVAFDGVHRRREQNDRDGVVEQAFGLEGAHDAAGNLRGLRDGLDGYRVGGRDHGAQGEREREGCGREQPHDHPSHSASGHSCEEDSQNEEGPPAADEHRPRSPTRHSEEQRRKEKRKDDLRVHREDGNRRHEREARNENQQQHRIRKAGHLPDPHRDDSHEDERQNHHQSRHPLPSPRRSESKRDE